MKTKKISLLMVLILGLYNISLAQQSKPKQDTLEDILSLKAAHKDGYGFDGRVIDIPTRIVKTYDKKKARIVGTSTPYKVERKLVDEKGDTIIYQGRKSDFFPQDSTNEDEKYWTGIAFKISMISIWDPQQRKWKRVYSKNQ